MPYKSQADSHQIVAFLRGINVGGHAVMKMPDLKKAFEKLGFGNVRTLLASGNVIFESKETDRKVLTNTIEAALRKAWKKDISVILRSLDDLKKLESTEPFKGIKATPSTRLYVTFLSEKASPRAITIPYNTPEICILHATPTEVCSVVDLSKGKGTPELMALLEREFGSNLTTRNWNTVVKALK